MKTKLFATISSAIVLSASVVGAPLFLLNLPIASRMATCLTTAFNEGKWSSDCASHSLTDFGLFSIGNIHDFDIDFSTPDHKSMGLASSGIDVDLLAFPGISWPIKDSSQSITIVHNGVEVGRFDNPTTPVTVNGNTVRITVNPTTLHVLNMDALVNFGTALLLESSVDTEFKGLVTGSVNVPIVSSLQLSNAAFSTPYTLTGGSGFNQATLVQLDSSAVDESGRVINVIEMNVHNPSRITVTFGDVNTRVTDNNGNDLGVATIQNMRIAVGGSIIKAVLHSPQAISTDNQILTFSGFDGSSPDYVANKIIQSLKIPLSISP